MSARTFPIHPKNRDLYGPGVYTQSDANTNGVSAFVFAHLELAGAENHNRRWPLPKKCGPFSVVSSRY